MSPVLRTKAFICYAPDDKRWLERILVHLRPLERQGRVDLWDVSKVQPGEAREHVVQHALQHATCAILLITPEFLASEAIMTQHIPALLGGTAGHGLRLLPLLIKPSLYDETCLGRFEPFNPDAVITKLSTEKQDELLVAVARTIREWSNQQADGTTGGAGSPDLSDETAPLAQFEQVSKHVEALGACKEIHEQLHQLQYTVYQVSLRVQANFPQDTKSYMEIKGYSRGLDRIVSAIKMNATQAPLELVTDLEETQEQMRRSLKERDVHCLQAAIEQMQRILQLFPPAVSHKIKDIVHQLGLEQILKTGDSCSVPWAKRFAELAAIGQQVVGVADIHHQWQLIELEMMGAEAVISYSVTPLQRMHYPRAKGWLRALLPAEPADWREEIDQAATALETAFQARDDILIRSSFEDYRRATGNRFHEVDLNLLALCRRLCKAASEFRDALQSLVSGRGVTHV